MRSHRRILVYLLRELLGPTLLGLALYTFVLLMQHFFIVAERSLAKDLGFELTARLFVVGIPKLLVLSVPMAVLLGTLIAMGRLSADHEWTALQSLGRGPGVLLAPVALHGLLATVFGLWIYGFVVPQANYVIHGLRGEIVYASSLASDLKPRRFYAPRRDVVLFVEDIAPEGENRLRNPLLIEHDRAGDAIQLVRARRGDLYPAPDGSGAVLVDLEDGEGRRFRSDPEANYRLWSFERVEGYRIEAPPYVATLFAPPAKGPRDYTLPELVREVKQAGSDRRAMDAPAATSAPPRTSTIVADTRLKAATVELHQRLALTSASFFFALLALPLGLTRGRTGKGAGFALSVLVIVVYRVVFVVTRNQSVTGGLPAEVGPWIANAVILVWAAWAFFRLRRSSLRRGLLGRLLTRVASLRARSDSGSAAPSADSENAGDDERPLASLAGSQSRFVGRLDRYVSWGFLRMTVFALVSAYVIFALIELQAVVDDAIRTGQPMALVGKYLLLFAPGILYITLPIACLIGAIVSFTLLARSSELTAMKAAGVGLPRATVPVLVLTVLFCGALFWIDDRIAPTTNRMAQEVKGRLKGSAPRTYGPPTTGQWVFGPGGTTLYHYRVYDHEREEFKRLNVLTLDRDSPRILEHRFGEQARWTGSEWELSDGWHRTFAPDAFERHEGPLRVALDPPTTLVRTDGRRRLTPLGEDDSAEQLAVAEIREQIADLEAEGYDTTKLRVALWSKFAHAASPLVMVLIGLPFAFKIGRRGSLYGVGVALLLVLVYWATLAVFRALGVETLLPAYLSAWAPTGLFALVGGWLLIQVRS